MVAGKRTYIEILIARLSHGRKSCKTERIRHLIDIASLNNDEQSVLCRRAQYCQAMCEADIDTMREIVSEDKSFTHMSGMTQSREEYFSDIAKGRLKYFTIGIADPKIKVSGEAASVTYTSIRWHLQAGNICIPGSSNGQHIIEDYDVWNFELTDEEMAQMTALERDERFADY